MSDSNQFINNCIHYSRFVGHPNQSAEPSQTL